MGRHAKRNKAHGNICKPYCLGSLSPGKFSRFVLQIEQREWGAGARHQRLRSQLVKTNFKNQEIAY
jgi:hypothetical protein